MQSSHRSPEDSLWHLSLSGLRLQRLPGRRWLPASSGPLGKDLLQEGPQGQEAKYHSGGKSSRHPFQAQMKGKWARAQWSLGSCLGHQSPWRQVLEVSGETESTSVFSSTKEHHWCYEALHRWSCPFPCLQELYTPQVSFFFHCSILWKDISYFLSLCFYCWAVPGPGELKRVKGRHPQLWLTDLPESRVNCYWVSCYA